LIVCVSTLPPPPDVRILDSHVPVDKNRKFGWIFIGFFVIVSDALSPLAPHALPAPLSRLPLSLPFFGDETCALR
jgi:hypothetical protein